MAYSAAADVYRFGWQTRQFVIDPNAQTRTSVLDCLAYPPASGIMAELENVAHEEIEHQADHPQVVEPNAG